jgi:hypothetical protein
VGAAVGVAALGSVLALIGAVFALRVLDDEAAETMHLPVRAKSSQLSDLQTADATCETPPACHTCLS